MSQLARRKLWFERNEQAEVLEAEGNIDGALALYEENAAEDCDVAYTYERMAALYRQKKMYDEEIEALEKALKIEEKRGPTGQMIRLKKRIETSQEVRKREGKRRPVDIRESSSGSTRRVAVKKKEKKGCLSVVFLFVFGSLLSVALFF